MTSFIDLTEYLRGQTYIHELKITDASGVLTDVDTTSCIILKPDGMEVDSGEMYHDGTGEYHYDYNIPADALEGAWESIAIAIIGTRIIKSRTEFLVR